MYKKIPSVYKYIARKLYACIPVFQYVCMKKIWDMGGCIQGSHGEGIERVWRMLS